MSAIKNGVRRASRTPAHSAALKVRDTARSIHAANEDLQLFDVGLELERLAVAVLELAAIVARMVKRQR